MGTTLSGTGAELSENDAAAIHEEGLQCNLNLLGQQLVFAFLSTMKTDLMKRKVKKERERNG